MKNGNFLKMRVNEIRVKRIPVNQGLGVVAISKNAMTEKMASAGIAGSSWIHYAKMQADIMNGHKENESKCQNDEQSLHQSKNGHFGIISGLDAY